MGCPCSPGLGMLCRPLLVTLGSGGTTVSTPVTDNLSETSSRVESDARQHSVQILLIEDNPFDAELFQSALKDSPDGNFTVQLATTLADALQALSRRIPDVMLVDLTLPDSSGLDTL